MHMQHPRTGIRHGWRRRHRDHDRSEIYRFFRHGRGGRSVRRGNVRFAILSALRDRPMHGYQVIQELETRTQGRWRPSAGSVYPTLQLLEDEGMLTSEEIDGRRTYSLTDEGRKAADEHPLSGDRWFEADEPDGPSLQELAGRLIAAAGQVERTGSADARTSAKRILVDARKQLFRILADDEDESAG